MSAISINTGGDYHTTVAPITAPAYAAYIPRPEFIRLPKPGTQCPYTGLSRTKMNDLVLPTEANGYRPPVASVSLRVKGAKRGTRLVTYASLLAYLNSIAGQEAQ